MTDEQYSEHKCERCGAPMPRTRRRNRFCSRACWHAVMHPPYRVSEADFWARTDRLGECWEYTANRLPAPKNYGSLRFRGGMWRAHRLAWTLVNGPIPAGLHVLHTCDNPPCVNPAHLRLGTNADNVADRERKHRRTAPHGAAHPQSKLTEDAVIAIRRGHAAGVANAELAARYGLHHDSIYSIVRRKTWRHVA